MTSRETESDHWHAYTKKLERVQIAHHMVAVRPGEPALISVKS